MLLYSSLTSRLVCVALFPSVKAVEAELCQAALCHQQSASSHMRKVRTLVPYEDVEALQHWHTRC